MIMPKGKARIYKITDPMLSLWHFNGEHAYCLDEDSRRLYERMIDLRNTVPWKDNLTMYAWGEVIGRLLQGERQYKLSAFYIEFANVADPGDPVAIPSYDRSDGIDYYNSLSGDPLNDYLRVPTSAVNFDSSDEELFPGGNQLTYFGRTTGVVGVHGKNFSAAENSKVFGGAAVVTPVAGDAASDIVFARFYCDEDEQQLMEESGQIAIEWQFKML